MEDIVLVEELLRVLHIGGAIDVFDAPLLTGLSSLAGEQNDGGFLAAQDGLTDGLAPVRDDGVVTALFFHILCNILANILHGLLAGVFLG